MATTALVMALPALILTVAAPGQAWAQSAEAAPAAIRFDIPAQPLAEALNAFGRQAGLQVTGEAAATDGLRSQPLAGRFTIDEALARMLAGTGIAWTITEDATVLLTRPVAAGGTTALDPLTVTGSRARLETATGPVEGYLATRSASATKTDTAIMDTPASVQVVPAEVIREQGALSLKDIYQNVSGVQQAGNTLNAQTEVLPIIRGFESPTLLRNGLRSTSSGAVDLVNVERVEVLKGPASILYGALEPGGIVNYVTKRPQDVAAASVEQQVGTDRLLRSSADLTGPLTADGDLLYRLNLAYTDAGSFRDEMEVERLAVAPSLLWRMSDDTELLIDLSAVHEEQPYDTGMPLDANGKPLVDRDTYFGDPDLDGRTIDDYTASYQLTHRIDDVWSLRNQVQFHRAEAKNESLRPRGVTGDPGAEALRLRYQNEDRREDEFQLVLDATANFEAGGVGHELLLGTDLIRIESDFWRTRQNLPDNVPISNDPQVNFDPPAGQALGLTWGKTEWAGFYLQDQISMLADGRLKLLLGGRYDIVHQENEQGGVASPEIDERAFTGRAGLLYQFTPMYSGYVSVSQSFQPQDAGVVDRSNQPLSPEDGLQYEVGVKASLLDDRLMATASVFQIEKENVAVLDQTYFNDTGIISYFPGVRERSRGFEVDVTGAITPEINLIANYSFTETETLENGGDPTAVGQPLGGVPRHKARLWLSYTVDEDDALGGLGFGAGARYVGTSSAQFDQSIKLAPYVVVDAGIWYDWKAARLGLNLYNLFDEDYIVRASDRSIAHPGEPLSAIASLSLRF
ncbi:TonB-dependent receptor [Tistrella bauzanensis]